MYVDMSLATPLAGPIPLDDLGRAALLLLFAYAGFENLPAAAGEYSNPRRDVPFAMLMMIASVTLLYFAVQWVALGTLPGLAQSQTPLADAAATFRSEEHTSELQSLMRISYAVFCLKKKNTHT